jgi:DNA polymerase-1
MNIIREQLPPKPRENEWVSIDTEMFRMNKNLMHRPTTGKFACMTVCLERDLDTVYITENERNVEDYLSVVDSGVWVMQNARFDIVQLRRYANIPPRKALWDTMLIEQIMYSGYYNAFSLADLARRYLRIQLDKSAREQFEDADEMNDELREYACTDTPVTLRVALEQKKIISKNDFNIWKNIECPFLFALADFAGFRIDYDGWKSMSLANKLKAMSAKESLPIAPDTSKNKKSKDGSPTMLNPDAPKQLQDYLSKHGFKGIPNAQADTLRKFVDKFPNTEAATIARKVLDYKEVAKNSSTYGMNWIETYAEKIDENIYVVYGNYHQIGAETGRTSCSDPNIQNVPNNDEYRSKFIARPGHKLIIADFSQQEPGISTYLSQDKNLLKANKNGDDIYIEIAKIFFKDNITKKDPRRKTIKALYLGLSYGLSAYGLAKREGISVEDAEELITQFFRTFSGLASWAKRQKKEKALVRTVIGRKVWLNPYSSQRERNALNAPHQGTGSDMMKLTINEVHKNWKHKMEEIEVPELPFSMVGEVHDEMILDVPEELAKPIAKWVASTGVAVAEKMCPGVRFKIGVEIGDSWSAKE